MAALSLAAIYGAACLNGSDEVLAGVGIALRLVTLGMLPVIGFCLGAQPVLSFACGPGDFARVLGALRFMLAVTSVGAAGYALVMMALAGPIAGLCSPTIRRHRPWRFGLAAPSMRALLRSACSSC